MGRYISVSEVRTTSGAPDSIIPDSDIETILGQVERETERTLNTAFKPTLRIDQLDGNNKDRITLEKNPVNRVRKLKIADTKIDPTTLHIRHSSGVIELGQSSERAFFRREYEHGGGSIMVEYEYGLMDTNGDIRTRSTADVSPGELVDIPVSADLTADLSADDYVEITGMDGNKEITKITNITSSEIKVDELIYSHESDSIITKAETPPMVKKFMRLEASIAVAINAIGSTYTFNTSYNIGDLQVSKGVPHPHWTSSVEKNIKERDSIKINARPHIT